MITLKARIAADNEDMAGVMSVTVFGHLLTQDYTEIEVSDDVAAKLKGNACIDVLVRKPKTVAEPAPAAESEAEPAAQPQG